MISLPKALIVVALFLVAVWAFFAFDIGRTDKTDVPVLTFTHCEGVGKISDTLPRVCVAPDGRSFTESVTNEESLLDMIRVTTPRPSMYITSPLTIEGFARGMWFFEGSFPVRLIDQNGKTIASGIAYAQDEWMTEAFVPFRAELTFSTTHRGVGKLILQKDNPSGEPSRDQALTMLLPFLTPYAEIKTSDVVGE